MVSQASIMDTRMKSLFPEDFMVASSHPSLPAQTTTSAVDMHVGFFNLDEVEPGYEFEGLLFVNVLVRSALAA